MEASTYIRSAILSVIKRIKMFAYLLGLGGTGIIANSHPATNKSQQ